MSASTGEAWFYHLERSSLDQVLPELLDKTLNRGWRALVRVREASLMSALDERLWVWRAESFLPHGLADAEHAADQPILLTASGENANGAQALFIVDGAELGDIAGFERCLVLFDGRDEAALAQAREQWKKLKAGGVDASYWRQNEEGAWSKAA